MMGDFFSNELGELIRTNGINSILIWYAGHGKNINETGYWVPVDAKRDDESTFFNTNTIRTSLKPYSDNLTHILLITDACESGPTFYQAMRTINTERNCSDVNAIGSKSSQVFTSTGYELAIKESQFTKTFANTLINNRSSCISIENIVIEVSSSVVSNNQQKPKFGKISGLSDENGTFFFIRK